MEFLVPTTRPIPTPSLPHPLLPLQLKITVSLKKSLPHPFLSILDHGRTKTALFSPRASASPSPSFSPSLIAKTPSTSVPSFASSSCTRWMVVMEKPPGGVSSKPEIVDYYVETLAGVLGSEKEAQMCIYDVSWQTSFGFCCNIDEEAANKLTGLPGVLSVRPDKDFDPSSKDYSSNSLPGQLTTPGSRSSKFSPPGPGGNSKYWLVRMEKPGIEVVTKAQMVDYYAQTLTKVLRNEKYAQVSIYNISWERDFGFCCHIDEDCAQELADVPGVLSVYPDMNFDSDIKDYRGVEIPRKSIDSPTSSETEQTPNIKTKRLFVTGLSFYTSEKTLRAAFEGYGELVEVKIIMDKISKRSKGYAFIEYTTEEAASAALKEMNGKIINGWMIVVDVAKTNPPRYSRGRP